MKSLIHKISSVILAVLVLLSTTSFALDAHFCGDTLVDLAVVQHAKTCDMDAPQDNSQDCDNITKSNCCSDLQVVSHRQEQVQPTISNLTVDQQIFVVSFIYTYVNLFQGLDTQVIPYKDYIPPLLTRKIQKLQEVYII